MDIDLSGVMLPDYLKSEDTGWLEPNGDFQPCGYTWHLDTARELYGTYDVDLLAKSGIAHIFWNGVINKTDYYIGKPLTDAQIKWLEERDIEIREEDRGRI